jgi:hypothetical protein
MELPNRIQGIESTEINVCNLMNKIQYLINNEISCSRAWGYVSITLVLQGLRHEDHRVGGQIGYIERLSLKEKKNVIFLSIDLL